MKTKLRRILFGTTLALLGVTGLAPHAAAQGCIPARFMALSLGPDGITQLQAGEWDVGVSFRYLYADQGWRGTDRWPAYSTIVGNRITLVSVDVQATYAFTPRYSLTLTLPYSYGQTSNFPEHDGTRHMVNAHGIGDVRLVGTAWLLDPATHADGNISIGFGFKAPTGEEAASAYFHKPAGLEWRPVDTAIQPGDGGWGVILEGSAFRKLTGNLYGYANGYYLINPKEQNKAYAPTPVFGQKMNLSVCDQYLLRAGLTLTQWPARHLSASLGVRLNGIPAEDIFGGAEGFRRPGYVIYAEPGVTWASGRNTFSLFVPLRLDANRTRNIYEQVRNVDGAGAFASYLVITSFSRKF